MKVNAYFMQVYLVYCISSMPAGNGVYFLLSSVSLAVWIPQFFMDFVNNGKPSGFFCNSKINMMKVARICYYDRIRAVTFEKPKVEQNTLRRKKVPRQQAPSKMLQANSPARL